MERVIHIDTNGNQWCIGNSPNTATLPVTADARWVILPISVEPMYPMEIEDDGIYSHCALCGRPIVDQRGLIVLEFVADAWGVRIGCNKCGALIAPAISNALICSVSTVLTPIITYGCKKVYNGCIICNRASRCNASECKKIIESGILTALPVDELLEHFYRVQLDVVSPLVVAETCAYCGKPCNRLCRVCRVVAYCNYGCKIKHGHGAQKSISTSGNAFLCTGFTEIWRNAQRIFFTNEPIPHRSPTIPVDTTNNHCTRSGSPVLDWQVDL